MIKTKEYLKFFLSVLAVLVGMFIFVTFLAGYNERSAASVVNQGCAKHKGVGSWGGSDSYSARCNDGYAFTGSSDEDWSWPW